MERRRPDFPSRMLSALLFAAPALALGAAQPAVDFDGAGRVSVSVRDLAAASWTPAPFPVRRVDQRRPGDSRGGDHGPGRSGRWDPQDRPWNGSQVVALAAQIGAQSEALRARYRQEKPGNFFKKLSWHSGYDPLELFRDRSGDFHRAVQRRYRDAEEVWSDYEAMISVWERVEANLPRAYHFDVIRDGYDRLEDSVRELRYFFRSLERRRQALRLLEESATRVRDRARGLQERARQLPGGDLTYDERRFLDDLQEVVSAAERLEEEVRHQSRRRDGRELRDRARRLVDDYERADRSFYNARRFDALRSDFRDLGYEVRRVEDSLRDLE